MLAIPQLFHRDREDLVADGFTWSVVILDFDLRDIRLAPGAHFDILCRLQNRVDRHTAEFYRRWQRGYFKLKRLDDFRAGRIHCAYSDRIPPWRQVGRIQCEVKPVAFNDNGYTGVGTYGCDWRLPGCQDTTNDGVANDCVFRHPFDFQARRNHIHIEIRVYNRTLTAGIGCADAQRMLSWAQFKGIQIELVGCLIVNLKELAIDEKLHSDNLSLATGINRNHFHIADFGLGRRLEVVGNDGRQGRNLEFCRQAADIAFDIADGDIEPMFAGLCIGGFNSICLFSRNDFAVKRDFDAFDLLVGKDLDLDLCILAECLGKYIIGQKEKWYGDGRAQDRHTGCLAAVRGDDFQRKVITSSVGRNIGIHGDDVLRTE